MDLLNLNDPHGPAWELFVVVIVVIVAPLVFERLRIPGLIGLLAGGCLLGPNVLDVISDSSGIVKELGTIGLLYLMFVAGLELDLAVFARFKRQAIIFALLTFAIPQVLGTLAGLFVDYDLDSSILLGSLFASYTLVVYPTLRNMGLSANRAVAATVGATVITDTLALVVLAAISGSATGDAGGVELLLQITFGLLALAAWCFLALPRIADVVFRTIGRVQTLRYVFVLAALLSAGVLAEIVGIEGIVGAFFAGLALNRRVPNGGEFMERIEFFGSALLIPLFLVSVGTVIDPRVLIDPETLRLGLIFTLACVGGKAIAAALCRPAFQFTWDEIGAVFGLSVAQAAATLAATFVGLEIGLFTTSTVNAVMIVIVVSLVLASLSAERFGANIERPPIDTTRLGRSVVAQIDDPADARAVVSVAARIASVDGGLPHPVLVVADGDTRPDDEIRDEIGRSISVESPDAHLRVTHDRTANDGVLHTAAELDASLLVVPAATQTWLPTLFEAAQNHLVANAPCPTALVRSGRGRPDRVVLVLNAAQASRPSSAGLLAARIAERLASGGRLTVVAAADLSNRYADIAAISTAEVVRSQSLDWLQSDGRDDDLYVVPGGRNGALGTARFAKQAASRGATLVVAADPESVSVSGRAATSLGLVTPHMVRT